MNDNSMRVKKLAFAGFLCALGVTLSWFYIPLGASKCFPVQHFINVISAVMLGPYYAVINACVISIIRNMLGMGSILAFPGSMVGALLAGLFYRRFKNIYICALGELIGTGLIGAIISVPAALLLLGMNTIGIFFFIIPFGLSSLGGSIFSLALLRLAPFKKLISGSVHYD